MTRYVNHEENRQKGVPTDRAIITAKKSPETAKSSIPSPQKTLPSPFFSPPPSISDLLPAKVPLINNFDRGLESLIICYLVDLKISPSFEGLFFLFL